MPTTATKNQSVACAVKWCVCLALVESQHCTAHQQKRDLHPALLTDADPDKQSFTGCSWCDGTRECESCDGDGEHQCDHDGCYDLHECGACDGTGECPHCDSQFDDEDWPLGWDEKYLRWANDTGWQPWQRNEPWADA
jgi:hypothetical protein